MATDINLMSVKSVFAAKVETTTGEAETLAAAQGKFNAYDVVIEPDITMNERQGQGSATPKASVPGGHAANIRLKTLLSGGGSGGTAAWLALLGGANFDVSGSVYTLKTALATTLTCGHFVDGDYRKAAGCKFDFTMEGTNGQPVVMNWTGRGVWRSAAASAIIAPAYDTIIEPKMGTGPFTIGGTAEKISKFTFTPGNQLYLRERQGTIDGVTPCYHAATITSHAGQFTCDPESRGLGSRDWYAAMEAGTEFAISLAIGSAANNICTLAAPKAQVVGVTPGSRNGIAIDQLTFQCNRSAAAGDDSATLTIS